MATDGARSSRTSSTTGDILRPPEMSQSVASEQPATQEVPPSETYSIGITYHLYMDKRIVDSNGALIPPKDDPPEDYEALLPAAPLPPFETALDHVRCSDFRDEVLNYVVASRSDIPLTHYLRLADRANKIQWRGCIHDDPDERDFNFLTINVKKNFAMFVRHIKRATPGTPIRLHLRVENPRVKNIPKWTGRGWCYQGKWPYVNLAYPGRKYRPDTTSRFLPSDDESETANSTDKKGSKSSASARAISPIPSPAPGSYAAVRAALKKNGLRCDAKQVIATRDAFMKR